MGQQAPLITTAGQPAQLDIRVAGANCLRITLTPISFSGTLPDTPAIAERSSLHPTITLRSLAARVEGSVGRFSVAVEPAPLRVSVRDVTGHTIQTLRFMLDGALMFEVGDGPVLGMGEGGPLPTCDTPWREQPVQFDRRGALDTMEPRWQSDMYGSRNPAAVLFGTSGWGIFVAAPWVQVDLRDSDHGKCLPVQPPSTGPQNHGNQELNAGKGLPPAERYVVGLWDVFVFDARDPTEAILDFAAITGKPSMPPRWALGYLQSHRTIEDETQLLREIDTFREKELPLDAVIYLGTGFTPVGWNKKQPSFEFNPDVFKRDPKAVLADMHAKHVKVVVHIVPWDRDRLPTLHGTIPAALGETVDESHIQAYWQQHIGLVHAGVDAFWADEGDWFNLIERIKRHQLYYQGSLSTTPNVRPWSLHRNGFPGIAQWGGWVWSGDPESSWKTLEAQIAVGLNYSMSIGPYWGSSIGGHYPNREYTGELYARWFQFATFCGCMFAHGRVWWLRLPWGWSGKEVGPLEYSHTNQAPPPGDSRNIDPGELGNPAIEPIAKKYAELRHQLMPYTYTLAREAHDRGLPLMRAMWIHYPGDQVARAKGDQFLWGRDLLIAPVYRKGATTRSLYLPAGDWYDWWTKALVAGGRNIECAVDLATMPIYARSGAIVPIDPIRQYTGEPVSGPTSLNVFPGANGAFTLYDDDGISQAYLDGQGNWIRMTWTDATRTLTLDPGAPVGATDVVRPRIFRVMMPDGQTQDVSYNGRRTSVVF